jgi:class 3 adenylate cyclase/tetratricopeptide (TPR) repeat protein
MDFYAVLDQVLALLRQRQRVTYRALKVQFQLDDEALEALRDELIEAQHLAADEAGKVLVWTGDAGSSLAPTLEPVRASHAYTPPHLAEKIRTVRSALVGERKQVTVLFADLKGSMELLADRDPEEARQLLDPALERMMAAVHRYEGTVNQVMGDGIMALFGAPIAHEDHAVRACYAALAMQEFVQRYAEEVRRTQGLVVQIRVGLNAGEVVVRAIGNDLYMDYSAIGQTTHLAARMEQLATPGSILLTATTLRLVEGLVRVNALGPVPVKGLAEPVEVFELVGVTAIRRRLQAAAARGLSRFVGRDHELESLQQALHLAEAGHGQIVAAVGEAGVGKSRLVYEFVHSYRTQGWLVLESASVSYGKSTPYFPVLDLLRRYCHLEDGDDSRTIRAKVTGQLVTLDIALQEAIPALLGLLDALPDDSPFFKLEPPQRRQRTLDALKRVLLRESQGQPLVLVFEDLHWIDTETQALLDSLIESLPTAQILLLVNYRPEYQHGWGSKTYYTQLRLDPLPPASANELLLALLGDAPSLAPLTQLLITRTQGNPFFLEESVRTLAETQVLVGERGAYRLAKALPSIQVPATVQAVLAARIDRLPPEEKQLLQTAAVIGTEVLLPLLQVIAELPEDALYRSLAYLQTAEFLYEMHLFPNQVYTFKHALTHEVAYGSLLQERRRTLHARIVEALEAFGRDRVTEVASVAKGFPAGRQDLDQVEQLAHHALRGEVWDKALAYLQQAGEKAMTHSAPREAVGYFEQALDALQHLPEQRDTRAQAIDLRLDLGWPLQRLGEWRRSLDILHEAEILAEALGDHRRLARVAVYIVNHLRTMGDYDRALAVSQRALVLATALGDVVLQGYANARLGQIYYLLGDYRRAGEMLRQSATALAGERNRERFGLPFLPVVHTRAYLVMCLAHLGAFAEGHSIGTETIRTAEAVNHPYSRATASYSIGVLFLRQGALSQAILAFERSLAICRAEHIEDWLPVLTGALGYAYALAGRLAEALLLREQATEQQTTVPDERTQTLTMVRWGKTCLLTGRLAEARSLAEQAFDLARTHQERGHEALALHLLGEVYAHGEAHEVEPAVGHYRQALTLADELGMRPLQAHCHLGLGTLYSRMGQVEQAYTDLSAAITLYRDMDMTLWLPQAEAALAQAEEA